MDMRTPLGRARGLGSARDGVPDWKMERLTALALVPLSFWLITFIIRSSGGGYAAYVDLISRPGNTALMILFIFCAFYHGFLGLTVVIEDYVHQLYIRYGMLLLLQFFMITMGMICVVSVLKVSFSFGL